MTSPALNQNNKCPLSVDYTSLHPDRMIKAIEEIVKELASRHGIGHLQNVYFGAVWQLDTARKHQEWLATGYLRFPIYKGDKK